jgi:TRAP-type mannitol/chloroaromatic compound transport system permease large subunit
VFFLAFFLDFFEIAFIIFPLLVPAATKLDIDLVWFGVMLGVLMQTSFLHPPFGAALFFLRAVAPREPYRDRVSGEMVQPVTTGQIYWGSIPFIVIQLLMVALVVVFPQMVMHYKSGRTTVAPSAVDKQLDQVEIPEFDPMEQPAPK